MLIQQFIHSFHDIPTNYLLYNLYPLNSNRFPHWFHHLQIVIVDSCFAKAWAQWPTHRGWRLWTAPGWFSVGEPVLITWRIMKSSDHSDRIWLDFDGFWWNHCNFHCKVNKDMFGALNGHDPISNGFLKSCAWGILSSSNLLVGAVPVRWGKYLKMPGLKWSCNQTIWFCTCLKMENVSLNDGHKMIRENDD